MNFSQGEKVLCYHGPLIYQAKVLEAEIWTGTDPSEGGFTGPHYFVHYQGWKQSWDEWVPESRMLKFNDENVARQKALVAAAKQKNQPAKEAAASSSAAAGAKATTSSGTRNRPRDSDETSHKRRSSAQADGGRGGAGGSSAKRQRGNNDGSGGGSGGGGGTGHGDDDDLIKKPEIRIQIPDSLKVQLVDDWENVTKSNQLVPLPRDPNVREVLKMYRKHVVDRRKEAKASGAGGAGSVTVNSAPLAVVDEVLKGLEVYFDKSLGNNLLYRYERQQYLQVRKGTSPQATGPAKATSAASENVTPTRASARGKKDSATGSSDSVTSSTADKSPSEVYGAEHLLRLFVNLPSIIAHTTMDGESVSILREHLDDFLHFMVKEKDKLFAKRYVDTSAVYARLGST
ncbi:unnamed protein product [Parajaminaea phylloscopi]